MKLSEYPGDNLLLFYDMLKPRSYLMVFTPLLKIHETVCYDVMYLAQD